MKAVFFAVALFSSFAFGEQRLGHQELANAAELAMADKKQVAVAMRMAISKYPELAKEAVSSTRSSCNCIGNHPMCFGKLPIPDIPTEVIRNGT